VWLLVLFVVAVVGAVFIALRPGGGTEWTEWGPTGFAPGNVEADVDGETVVLSFVGGRAPGTDRWCAADYRAQVDERAWIEITFEIREPEIPAGSNIGCDDQGFGRTLTVQLARPVGSRLIVVNSGDRSALVHPPPAGPPENLRLGR
jgi:hypothetical protein